MFRWSRSPRLAYVVVAVVLLLALQLAAVAIAGVTARDQSLSVARDAISRETDTTIESILRHLEPAEQSVGVTSRLLADDLIDLDSPSLERYLFTQLAVMPQMTGAFVGFPDGAFVFVNRDEDGFEAKRISIDGDDRSVVLRVFDDRFTERSAEPLPTDTYDPTVRPWYEQAVSTGDTSWTEPYVFFTSGRAGVTASRAVRDPGGGVVAVVGVDVELSGLGEFIDKLAIAESGEAFVFSGANVVAAPTSYERRMTDADGSPRLLTSDELGLPGLEQADERVRTVEIDGTAELILQRPFPESSGLEWSVAIRAPESAFTSAVNEQQRVTWWIILVGGLIVVVGALLLVRVTRPITHLHTQATTDPLTGLDNRRQVNDRASAASKLLGPDEHMSVLVVDLDGFKELNDRFGHDRGDRALEVVAETLRSLARHEDIVGRLGGDEFIVVQRVRSLDEGVRSARRIVDGLGERLREHLPSSPIGATGGLTISDEQVRDFDLLLLEADAALIRAKADYKGMLQLGDRLVSATLHDDD
ncbi:MAG: diguanylate cyclase [Actinomycetota bacterium]